MIISFAKTVPQFKAGLKTATRRIWKEKYLHQWQRAWDSGKRVHQVYDKVPYAGGKQIGKLRMTKRPYLQPLNQMNHWDLLAEGGMCATVEEFCQLIDQAPNAEVAVIEFEPIPDNYLYPIEVWPYRHTGWNGLLVPGSTTHPAKMARWILENIFDQWVEGRGKEIYDPFGGVGTSAVIGYSRGHNVQINELEIEFYNLSGVNMSKIHRDVNKVADHSGLYLKLRQGDSTKSVYGNQFNYVVTSPPYADVVKGGEGPGARHDFKSHRVENAETAVSRADYGKGDGQIGNMGWNEYWKSMRAVYKNCYWSLKSDGVMIVVVKDYIRNGRYVRFPWWTIKCIEECGFKVEKIANAMLVEESSNVSLFGEPVVEMKAHESQWRRMDRQRGLPIDYEVVIYARRL